jgi:hypothetical protein
MCGKDDSVPNFAPLFFGNGAVEIDDEEDVPLVPSIVDNWCLSIAACCNTSSAIVQLIFADQTFVS